MSKASVRDIPGEGTMKFAGQVVLPTGLDMGTADRVLSSIAISTVATLGLQGWYVVTRDRFYFSRQSDLDAFREIVLRAI